MKNKWMIYTKKANFLDIAKKNNISPIVAKVLVNRDIKDEADIHLFLNGTINDLRDYNLLNDIDKATKKIEEKIKNNKKILIVGDYDIDGISATYILYDSLKKLNANVYYKIPERIKDGYGINKRIIEEAIKENVDTIITCDNGISAIEEIKLANENNITVIVSDHHNVGGIANEAYCIVNPKKNDNKKLYPFDGICGASVALKLICKLYHNMNLKDPFFNYLEFACLATIGDIMPMIDENHIIAKEGLKKINEAIKEKNMGKVQINKGFYELLNVQSLLEKEINETHMGYLIGPLVNASGRLKNAYVALNLFISQNDDEIKEYAKELKILNDERKQLTEDNTKKSIEEVEKNCKNDNVLVVYDNTFREEVIGIVAGRIKEKYYKPAIVISNSDDENIVKGSARSIEEYDMFYNLSIENDLFIRFGGHKGAAGFSMYKKNIEKLKERLNKNCTLTKEDCTKKFWVDASFPLKFVNLSLMDDLEKLKPFGTDTTKFPSPLFGAKDLNYSIKGIYGIEKNVIKLSISDGETYLNAVYFGDTKEISDSKSNKDTKINILFEPQINEYMGKRSVEVVIKDYYFSQK
ncbi:MAG: single-stranded-DNA-specific exonuclease RecJ [Eubacteriales bacterium]|nr:single-stranded-DNA-specific exonuclease RecJ [Eubacteriales bacterium]